MMRKAAGGELCAILLLLAGTAAAAAEEVAEPQQLPWPWNVFLPPISDGKILECWTTLLGTENCVDDLFRSFFRGPDMQLSRECCNAVEGLGDYCFPKIFGLPPFGSWFPPLIKGFCAAPPPTSPAGHF